MSLPPSRFDGGDRHLQRIAKQNLRLSMPAKCSAANRLPRVLLRDPVGLAEVEPTVAWKRPDQITVTGIALEIGRHRRPGKDLFAHFDVVGSEHRIAIEARGWKKRTTSSPTKSRVQSSVPGYGTSRTTSNSLLPPAATRLILAADPPAENALRGFFRVDNQNPTA
jgi:hypothetical protein